MGQLDSPPDSTAELSLHEIAECETAEREGYPVPATPLTDYDLKKKEEEERLKGQLSVQAEALVGLLRANPSMPGPASLPLLEALAAYVSSGVRRMADDAFMLLISQSGECTSSRAFKVVEGMLATLASDSSSCLAISRLLADELLHQDPNSTRWDVIRRLYLAVFSRRTSKCFRAPTEVRKGQRKGCGLDQGLPSSSKRPFVLLSSAGLQQ